MLSQCLVPSITRNVISFSLVLGQQTYKTFIKVFQYILKSIETVLIQNYFFNNTKKSNKTKKTGKMLILEQMPKLKNYFDKV